MRIAKALLALPLAVAAMGQSGGTLTLAYRQPAQDWQTQALPIGNGRLGAMIFGDAQHEHLQLNEISLWTGNEKDTGRYQNLGDLTLDLDHGPADPSSYKRQLDLATATHTIEYSTGGVSYRRESFASFPQQVLVFRFSADRPGGYSGTLRLADAHSASLTAVDNALTAAGNLENGLGFETQVLVLHTGGEVHAVDGALHIRRADALTVLVDAGTNYLPDRKKFWRGENPHDRVSRQLRAAAALSFADLRSAHVADYRSLFDRVSLRLGTAPDAVRALSTEERLVAYSKGASDPDLEALFF